MKTALVLSGGGMFGAYQAGVWRALAPRFHPDLVVGASVGALNGWLIASGVAPEEIAGRWLNPDSAELMKYRFPRKPWRGIFDPAPLERRAKQLVSECPLRLPFGVALIELPWFKPKLVRDGEITWRHLVATCAIPGGFPPVRIDGKLYCDGGLINVTPIWAAAAMGATRAIGVDANRFLPPAGSGLVSGVLGRIGRARIPKHNVDVTMITSKDYLGKLVEGAKWNRELIAEWIERGEADAREIADQNNL